MNSINLIGNITKDLEIKTSSTGTKFLYTTLAVKKKRSEGTDFIPLTLFGKTAELLHTYCKKGSKIGISGRLEITTKNEEGKYQTLSNVIVEDITFIENKNPQKEDKTEQEKIKEVLERVNTGIDEEQDLFSDFWKD